ncbi:hypothetical protein [Flavobacterium psychrotrophum]|uniref:hypothetical protein n=1 Tax=Flavobacterium psychrotrophum TaxID=2294119 RepID=UPI000E3193D5|nr:hypothetical protein [Flavobacterium psychrotrophum]
MIVVTSKYLVPKGYTAIALFPFVFVRDAALASHPVLLNHERIHLRQQAELLVLPFYMWYIIEYGIRYLKYKDQKTAYRNISFEREAYANEKNMGYLRSRYFWKFFNYLKI